MTPEAEQLKALMVAHFEDTHRTAPGKMAAINWPHAVNALDGAIQKYLPVLGPLAPVQIQALANLVAEAVALLDKNLNPGG